MINPQMLAGTLLFGVACSVMVFRPDFVIRWMLRFPKPLVNLYFVGFKMRGIDPDSSEGYRWYRLAGVWGLLLTASFLVLFVLENVGLVRTSNPK